MLSVQQAIRLNGTPLADKHIVCRSPFFIETTDAQADLIDPALKGTANVLSSAVKAKDSLKRIILTSSVAGWHHPPVYMLYRLMSSQPISNTRIKPLANPQMQKSRCKVTYDDHSDYSCNANAASPALERSSSGACKDL